jgi:anti-sigma regulatory factor (Ser/Thr protein kinase)
MSSPMLTMSERDVDNIPAAGEAMTRVRARGEQVRTFMLQSLEQHPRDIVPFAAQKFQISRQAAHRHLRNLISEKAVTLDGNTRSRVYKLAPLSEWQKTFHLEPGLTEGVAWRDVGVVLGALPENVREIWQYGFTEMFNNVIDHSESKSVVVDVHETAASAEMSITDFGVGIFHKIQTSLGLADERHAVLELAKGKFTSDPKHHSGEGIFFSSRSFDNFQILSGQVHFAHKFGDEEDWILGNEKGESRGTMVRMRLSNHTARTLAGVFEEYADVDHGFTKTVVPVRIAQYGDDNLVSRSQAKRLLARFDRFRTVVLDFTGVETIGQGFADEVFRVFPSEHPQVELMTINALPSVKAMIAHVLA